MTNQDGPASWSTPLRRWSVRNFKSIREADLDLSPLTILVGPNSAGKSSFIQSLLLLVQAAQGGTEGPVLPLNGPYVAAGNFPDARFANTKEPIGLGGTFEPSQLGLGASPELRTALRASPRGTRWGGSLTVEWSAEFDAPAPEGEPGSADLSSVELRATLADEEPALQLAARRRGQGPLEEDRIRVRAGLLAAPTREVAEPGFTGRLTSEEHEETVRGLLVRAALPHNVLKPWRLGDAAAWTWIQSRGVGPFWAISFGLGLGERSTRTDSRKRRMPEIEAQLEQLAQLATDEINTWATVRNEGVPLPQFLAQTRTNISPEQRALLREFGEELVQTIQGRLELNDEVYLPPDRPLAQRLYSAASEVHEFLRERVVYLGPLRQDPQVVYKTAPAGVAGFIGTKGEYTATVLHAYRNRDVQSFGAEGEQTSLRLSIAVDEWAQRLQIADELQTKDLARLGIQMLVRRGQIPPVDITGVGVGVSQLLPVIVMCLTAEPGSLVCIEQPELHLHPALQQRLADFLLACAKSGRQLVVETHSEYLVSRLRRRIAEDEADELIGNVALYFAEQLNDESRFRRVALNEYGGIEEWPVGFFDQAANDSRALIEAGLSKRSRRGELG